MWSSGTFAPRLDVRHGFSHQKWGRTMLEPEGPRVLRIAGSGVRAPSLMLKPNSHIAVGKATSHSIDATPHRFLTFPLALETREVDER